jgi:hypothetical protein
MLPPTLLSLLRLLEVLLLTQGLKQQIFISHSSEHGSQNQYNSRSVTSAASILDQLCLQLVFPVCVYLRPNSSS